jgi:hypothetical protein
MSFVSDARLVELVKEHSPVPPLGVAVMGSFARGDEDEFSDIDVAGIHEQDEHEHTHRVVYEAGRLVSIASAPASVSRRHMSDPGYAIAAVPSYRIMRILLDTDGLMAQLKSEALAFTWADIAEKADAKASREIADTAEEVHKTLRALSTQNIELACLMAHDLTRLLQNSAALYEGVVHDTENRFYSAVRAAMGADSEWSRLQREANGEVIGLSAFDRCASALSLYEGSLARFSARMDEADRQTAEEAVCRIRGFRADHS